MYQTIRQAIIDVISNPAVTHVEKAYRTDRSDIDGYPAALVFPTEHQAEYHQTSPESNKETYLFTVRVIVPFTEGQDEADIKLEKAMDQLITLFRDRNILGPGVADWLKPVPGRWGYQDRGNGVNRIGELSLQVTKYVDPSSS